MKPDILNPKWPYVPSVETDLRKTFAKERKRLADAAKKPVAPVNVVAMGKRGEGK